eukprot:TRINITY_DN13766_c0_g1_i1.p1 TRINITY_DN13766_c0_g1~~TRINITY_DN13766_c0_g1_i1.p1  ORF type:complete len:229 (+),score=20.12 TRINITY_DN13766_c0_g1_i1:34-687(+)
MFNTQPSSVEHNRFVWWPWTTLSRWQAGSRGRAAMMNISVVPEWTQSEQGGLQQDLMSLPLLYAQAFAVNHHFQAKCAEWGAGLGLYIPGIVKQPRRAIQKIWRTYNGQPQRLVDIVRASIVCDTTLELLTVLRRIEDDTDAGIVRIKNRFDPSYDSDVTAGYRCLALNIIIVNQRTRNNSAEKHICELQLGLHKMHELKTDGGHSRFVAFRDSSAE